jgi:hypothetical protein
MVLIEGAMLVSAGLLIGARRVSILRTRAKGSDPDAPPMSFQRKWMFCWGDRGAPADEGVRPTLRLRLRMAPLEDAPGIYFGYRVIRGLLAVAGCSTSELVLLAEL